MTTIVFLDTETTSLRHDRRAWEIAAIIRQSDGIDVEYSWMIAADDLDLGNADLKSLQIGRFYDRHPQANGDEEGALHVDGEAQALALLEQLTRGAHVVGAVPSFDAEVLGNRMRANGICPSWHYHLVDVENLIVGYLAGLRKATNGQLGPQPPWKSDELSLAIGIEPPADADRHTALGDARWVRDQYDAVMAGDWQK